MKWEKQEKFSIRKLNVGAASVLIAAGWIFAGQNDIVNAEESRVDGVQQSARDELPSSQTATENTKADANQTAVEKEAATTESVKKDDLKEVKVSYKVVYVDKKTKKVVYQVEKTATLAENVEEVTVVEGAKELVHAEELHRYSDQSGESLERTVTLTRDSKDVVVTYEVEEFDNKEAFSEVAKPQEEVKSEISYTVSYQENGVEVASEEKKVTVTATSPVVSAKITEKPTLDLEKLKNYTVAQASKQQVVLSGNENNKLTFDVVGQAKVRNNRAAQTQGTTIKFLDEQGNEVNPNTVVNDVDGQNIRLKAVVKFDQNATDRKVTLTLGNLMSFVDTGANDSNLKEALKDGTQPTVKSTGVLQSRTDNSNYSADRDNHVNIPTNYQATYEFKEGILEAIIPFTIRMEYNARTLGISTDGAIDGSTDRIERTTPVTGLSSAMLNGATVEGTNVINKIKIETALPKNEHNQYGHYLSPGGPLTNANNFTSDYEIHLGPTLTSSRPMFTEGARIELTLPKGVTLTEKEFSKNKVNRLSIQSSEVQSDGTTKLVLGSNQALGQNALLYSFFGSITVDPTVNTEERLNVNVLNATLKIRNYDQDVNLNSQESQRFSAVISVFRLGEGENISFNNSDYPRNNEGGTTFPQAWGAMTPGDAYTGLSMFTPKTIVNFSNKDTTAKELHYEFPPSEDFAVKGIVLPGIENNGHVLTSIKVRTKNSPNWKTITLDSPYTFSRAESSRRTLDVVQMGYDKDDVLTDVIVPIGKIPANHTAYSITPTRPRIYDLNGSIPTRPRDFDVFGTSSKVTNTMPVVAKVHLQDEGYDSNTNQNKPITATLGANFTQPTDLVSIDSPSSQTVENGSVKTLNYTVSAQERTDTWTSSVSEIEEINMVFPSDVKIKDIRIKHNGQLINQELLQTTRQVDGNTFYTFKFTNATGLHKYVGFTGIPGSEIKHQVVTVEVDIENNVTTKKDINLQNTLFVTTTAGRPNTGDITVKRNPYKLADDSRVFGSGFVGSVLTLSQADRLTSSTKAKLSNEPEYKEIDGSYKLTSIKQNLDMEFSLNNPLNKSVGEVDLFLPIPKKGQNWGSNFQNKSFDYSLELNGSVTSTNPEFNNTFEISYATVDESKLTGAKNYTTSELANENFSSNISSTTNLIRIKSKPGVNLSPMTNYPIRSTYRLADVTENEDGANVSWKGNYYGNFGTVAGVYQTGNISLDIALGRITVRAYNDKNLDGLPDAGEEGIANAKVTLYDAKGAKAGEGVTDGEGKVYFDALKSKSDYTVRVENPDGKVYAITSGKISSDKSFTTETVTATLTEKAATTPKDFGMSSTKITYTFRDGGLGVLSETSSSGLYTDSVVAPTVTPSAGYAFVGWENASGQVVTSDFLSKQAYGKTNQTYTAKYVELQTTITPTLNWVKGSATNRPNVVLVLKNGTQEVARQTVAGGSQPVAWTRPTHINGAAANYVVAVEGTIPGYGQPVVTAGNETTTDLPANATNLAGKTFVTKTQPVTITATYQGTVQDVTAKLQWASAPNVKPSVDLKLQRRLVGQSDFVDVPGQTATIANGTTSHVFQNMPTTDDNGVAYEYKVVQTSTPQGYQTDVYDQGNTFTVSNNFVDALKDWDNDGLTNIDELNGTRGKVTDPNKADTDSDGVNDLEEFQDGTDPTDPNSKKTTSAAPTVDPLNTKSTAVTGTATPNATVQVQLPNGSVVNANADSKGKFNVPLPTPLTEGQNVTVTQTAPNQRPSAPVVLAVTKAQADTTTLAKPASDQRVAVDNPASVQPTEAEAIKDLVNRLNPTIAKDKIAVANDGTATVTFADGSTAKIPGSELVVEKQTSEKPTTNPVDSDDRKITGTGAPGATVTATVNGQKLTATVQPNGQWEVPLNAPLATGTTVSVTQQAPNQKASAPATLTVVASDAEKANDLKAPALAELDKAAAKAKVEIESQPNLSPEEKAVAKQAVEAALADAKGKVNAATTPSAVAVAKDAGIQAIEDQSLAAAKKDAGKAIDKAVAEANKEINAHPSLDAAAKKVALDKVAAEAAKAKQAIAAQTTAPAVQVEENKGVDAIKAVQVEAAKADAVKGIDQAAADAKKAIDALPNLSADEKKAAQAKVDAAATAAKGEIAKATDPAQAQAAEDAGKKAIADVALAAAQADADKAIDQAAADAKKTIEAQPNLSADEKKAAQAEVDDAAAKAKADVAKATDPAAATAAAEAGKGAVQDARDAAAKQSEDNKKAKDAAALQAAKDAALKELAKAGQAAADAIEALPNLSKAEKDGLKAQAELALEKAKNKVEKATDVPGVTTEADAGKAAIQAVVDVAKATDKANELAKAKADADKAIDQAAADAKKAIEAQPNLSADEKKAAQAEVDAAATAAKGEIAKATDPAQAQAAEDAGKKAIADVALAAAQADADKAIDQAAADAKKTIEAQPNLSADEKKAAQAEVDAAATAAKGEIAKATDPAQAQAAEDAGKKAIADVALAAAQADADKAIDQAAADAKKTIEAQPNLSADEKKAAQAEVDAAATAAKGEIAKATDPAQAQAAEDAGKKAIADVALAAAKADADKAIDQAAADAKKTIEAQPNLSADEKKAAQAEVDAAATAAKGEIAKATDPAQAQAAEDAGKKAIADVALVAAQADADKAIDQAAADAKKTIEAQPNLSADEKKAAQAEVDAAATAAKGEIAKATDPAQAQAAEDAGKKAIADVALVAAQADADKAIDQAAADAKKTIEAQPNLSADEKKAAQAEVDAAATAAKGEIAKATDPAQAQAAEDAGKKAIADVALVAAQADADKAIDQAAADAKKTIEAQPNLSADEKKAAQAEVDAAATAAKGEIAKATDPAQAQAAEDAGKKAIADVALAAAQADADKAIDQAAADAKKAIEAQPNLSADEKKAAQAEVDAAATAAKGEIAKATDPAQAQAAEDAGKAAIQAVVDGAKATDKVNELAKAKADAKKALDKAAEDAKKAIDALPYLSQVDKDKAKVEIDQARDAAKAKVDQATDKAQVPSEVDKGQTAISNLVAAASAKQSAKGDPAIREELPEYQLPNTDEAVKALDQAAEDAKKAIDALPNLSNDEKTAAKQAVDQARVVAKENVSKTATVTELAKATDAGKAAIQAVVDGAKATDTANELAKVKSDAKKAIDKAAEDAKKAIDQSQNLSQEDKDKAKAEIDKARDAAKAKVDQATDKAQIPSEVEKGKGSIQSPTIAATELDKAKADAKKAIDKAAEDAKKAIDQSQNLSQADKDKAKAEIDKARDAAKAKVSNSSKIADVTQAVTSARGTNQAIIERVAAIDSANENLRQQNRKDLEKKVVNELPNTGAIEESSLATLGIMGLLGGLGLAVRKRKED